MHSIQTIITMNHQVKSILVLLLALLTLIAGPLLGQEKISLEAAIEMGLSNHISSHEGSAQVEISEINRRVSRSRLLPELAAKADLINYFQIPVQAFPAELVSDDPNVEPGTQIPLRVGANYQMEYGLTLNWALIDLQKWHSLRAESLREQLSTEAYKDEQAILAKNIANAWFQAAIALRQEEFFAELASTYDTLTDLAAHRFEQGYLEQSEYNRARSAGLIVQKSQYNSSIEAQNALLQLRFWLGTDPGTVYSPDFDFEAMLPQLQESYDATQHPAYAKVLEERNVRKVERRTQLDQYLPTLNLQGSYTRVSFSNEFNFFGSSSDWFNVGWIGLNLRWTLFNGLRVQQQHKLSQIRLNLAERKVQEFAREQEIEYRKAAQAVRSAYEAADLMEHNLALMQENHSIAEFKFGKGLISATELKESQRELLEAHQQYLSTLLSYYQYLNQLHYLEGSAQ